MHNDLYHGHAEQMVRYEMDQVDRAVEQARLLHEAGLTGPSWLTRTIHGLGNLLKAHGKGLQAPRQTKPMVVSKKSPRAA